MKTSLKSESTRWLVVAMAAALVFTVACGDEDDPGVPEEEEQIEEQEEEEQEEKEEEEEQEEEQEEQEETDAAEFALTPAGSCDDVRDHLAGSLTESTLDILYGNHFYDTMDAAPEDGANSDSGGADEGSDSPSEYTDTNVQEEGVDEPDIVKTDGNYIYAIADGALQIVKSWPAEETELVGRYDLSSNQMPIALFLNGDEVVVFSRLMQHYNPYPGEYPDDVEETDEPEQESRFRGTSATFIDVSDRSDPEFYRQLEVEGDYVNGRMVGDEVFLVTNSYLRDVNAWRYAYHEDLDGIPERDYNESDEELKQMRDEARPVIYEFIRAELDELSAEDWLPRQRILDVDGDEELFTALHKCEGLYLPGVSADLGILNISSFDFSDDTTAETTGLVARGWEVYASKQNLYVTMSSRTWWWGWWGGNRDNESHIHKFSLESDGEPAYLASGRVDGWILNQFSMSEYDGHLRVGTTDNQWEWNPDVSEMEDDGGNHLIILKREGDELVETGSVRDLAPTEQIHSARFMGDRGFMVTFFMVDPFYTFDLSDPTDPKVLGELEIEGFSSYMHPLDDDHLLAIGLDGDENGMMTGVHLQVFDVTDMTDPQRIHHHVISTGGWSSWSEAMHNHHAFTYQPRLGVLGVPVSVYDQGEHFSGLMLFDATIDGIEEIGRVDHVDLVAQSWCQANAGGDSDCDYDPAYHPWTSNVRRSIMMSGETDDEEYVYSLSGVGMKVNKTFDPSEQLASVLMQK